ncbi:MerR family transcriptional regulator [Solwaraspora sp. WMMD791]|uniref:MerR family transcriptional regulator n=1 Tax=Solwaraspora sp. WMMD791 TaxID=3016086 RepID=UPI0032B5912C
MRLLTIGAFGRASGLTVKALRIYADLGLLRPAAVDPDSGYRYYAPDQLELARLVARLRRTWWTRVGSTRPWRWRTGNGRC